MKFGLPEDLDEKNIFLWSLIISIMFFPVNIKILGQHFSPTFTISGILMSINFYALAQTVRKLAIPTNKPEKFDNKPQTLSIFAWICVKIVCIALLIVFLAYYPNSSSISAVLGVSIIPAVIVLKSIGKIMISKQTN